MKIKKNINMKNAINLLFCFLCLSCSKANYYKLDFVKKSKQANLYYSVYLNKSNHANQFIVKTDSLFNAESGIKAIQIAVNSDTIHYQNWNFPTSTKCFLQQFPAMPLINIFICKANEYDTLFDIFPKEQIRVIKYKINADPSIPDMSDLKGEIHFIPKFNIILKEDFIDNYSLNLINIKKVHFNKN